jgi:hypothetical protein
VCCRHVHLGLFHAIQYRNGCQCHGNQTAGNRQALFQLAVEVFFIRRGAGVLPLVLFCHGLEFLCSRGLKRLVKYRVPQNCVTRVDKLKPSLATCSVIWEYLGDFYGN